MPEINGVNLPFMPLGGTREFQRTQTLSRNESFGIPFRDLFENEAGILKFSAHAQTRLASRDIALSSNDLQRLEQAVAKVGQKGGKDSLIVLRDMAFIVSVANNTVITAIGGVSAENIVFTNIDSAVFA